MNIFAKALDLILGISPESPRAKKSEQFSVSGRKNAIVATFLSDKNIMQLAKRAQNRLPTLHKSYNEMLILVKEAAPIWADQNNIGASTLLDETAGNSDDLITYINNQFLDSFADNFAANTEAPAEPDLNFDRHTVYTQDRDGNWEHKSVEFLSPSDYNSMSNHDWDADEVYTADHRARNCGRVDVLSRSGLGSTVLNKVDRDNPDGYAHGDPDDASYDTQLRRYDMTPYTRAPAQPLRKHASSPWGS